MTFVPPVDALNRAHGSLWGNLGDWSRATEYVEAAAALARRLGEAAGLAPGQHVVDLGPGGGDQLRMWVETFGVERVTAVELDPGLAGRAAERVKVWGLDTHVRMVAGEATRASWSDTPVDRVVALDSAYFFASRETFLRRCASALRPEGVLAITDLLDGGGIPARLARAVSPLFGVPGGSISTEPRYRARLAEHGFDDITIHDCTDEVLGGFSRWVRGGGVRRDQTPDLATRLGLSITGRAAGLLGQPGGLRYVVVSARRRGG